MRLHKWQILPRGGTGQMGIFRGGLIIAGLLSSSAAWAGTPGWSISEMSGQVSILSPGISHIAHRGGAVEAGQVVATGATGRAVLTRGEEYLIVAPNSRIRVADPVKSGGMTQIIEQAGNVIFKIKKMVMPHFAVETPFLAAVVKGTTFSVTVTDKGASVQVIEGRVEVSTRDGGASYMVLPGDIGSVSANAPLRLNVQGRENRGIDSTGPKPMGALFADPVADSTVEATPSPFEGTIPTPVSEGPVRLDALSEGLVRGDSSLTSVVATSAPANHDAVEAARTQLAANTSRLPPAPPATEVESLPVGATTPPVSGVTQPPVIVTVPTVVTVAGAPVSPPPPPPPVIVTAPTVVTVAGGHVPTPPPVVVAVTNIPVIPRNSPPANGNNGNGQGTNGNGSGNNGNGQGTNGNGNNQGGTGRSGTFRGGFFGMRGRP